MDLTALIARLPEQGYKNTIIAYEKGQLVRRDHAAVHTDVRNACTQLAAWGVKPGMRVGIFAPNSYQWMIHELALIELRAISVVFTDDFKGRDLSDLCEKYSLSLLLVSAANAPPGNSQNLPVAFLDATNTHVNVVDRGGETADQDYEKMGLIFSSGSSGGLKGIILNRKGVEASLDAMVAALVLRRDDCLLLFLPMSNFQQRLMYYAALWYGFDMIITDHNQLFRAMKELQPTMLIAPPALYEALETRFSNLPGWKRRLASMAGDIVSLLPTPTAREKAGKLIFKQIHEALGGRMRLMVTGMAPIKRSALKLFERMQLSLYETYGLVECGSLSLNNPAAGRLGSVGRPLPGVTIALAPDGEIIAHRQPLLASGYFECAEGEQERTFIGDNRVATGDIGRLDDDGYLYLIGRKKEIIVTGGGKKIHPEVLEAEIDACPDVAKSVIFRNPDLPSLIAVVVFKNAQDLDARNRIQKFVDHVNERYASTPVAKIIFTDVVFSRENGLLRPNLKLDRRKIAQRFDTQPETALS
jgi:long-chain acyl-CoA synthetase